MINYIGNYFPNFFDKINFRTIQNVANISDKAVCFFKMDGAITYSFIICILYVLHKQIQTD